MAGEIGIEIDGAVAVGAAGLERAEVLCVMPPLVAAPEAEGVAGVVRQEADYKGYEALNPAFISASIALLAKLNLLGGKTISQRYILAAGPEQRYLQASLDCLEACGFLERHSLRDDGVGEIFYEFTESGLVLAEDIGPVLIAVNTYAQIMRVVKYVLGDDGFEEEFDVAGLLTQTIGSEADRLRAGWVVPAVTVFSEMEFQSGALIGENVAEALAEGKLICLTNLTQSPEWPFHPAILIFVHVLEEMGLLEQASAYPYYCATPKGRKVFALGGYSELILSYFRMMKGMDSLTKRELTYGPDGDINRDPKLNARASSGILEKRVAPYIVEILGSHPELRGRLNNGATVDFGSGGGEMVQRAADVGESLGLRKSYGMDISPGANEAAREELGRLQMVGRAEIVQGSILNEEDLEGLADRISESGIDLRNVVATINFILHDVGHRAAETFLRSYAKIFGNAPLIVTETMKMSTEVLRAHPNYQAMSFQFMHTASGQELFTEWELLALFEKCGYEVVAKKVHSSMPGIGDEDRRHDTIITFTIQSDLSAVA